MKENNNNTNNNELNKSKKVVSLHFIVFSFIVTFSFNFFLFIETQRDIALNSLYIP